MAIELVGTKASDVPGLWGSATDPNVRTDEHLGRVTQVIAGARDPLQRAQGGSNVGSLEAR